MLKESPTDSLLLQTLFEMGGITPATINKRLEDMMEEAVQKRVLFWDIQDMMRATTFSKTFLEEHILPHPKVRVYERQRDFRGKRIWLHEPTAKAIVEIIMNEW